jgi:hypothetical protein
MPLAVCVAGRALGPIPSCPRPGAQLASVGSGRKQRREHFTEHRVPPVLRDMVSPSLEKTMPQETKQRRHVRDRTDRESNNAGPRGGGRVGGVSSAIGTTTARRHAFVRPLFVVAPRIRPHAGRRAACGQHKRTWIDPG